MSPRKLSAADKNDILNLYRHREETTSTLATRYQVSNSTISRILKSSLLESEYEALIQQKRANRTPGNTSSSMVEPLELTKEFDPEPLLDIPTTKPSTEVETQSSVSASVEGRRRRRRSSVPSNPGSQPEGIQTELELDIRTSSEESDFEESDQLLDEIELDQTIGLEEFLDEDLIDLEDLEEDLEDLEDLEEDWEDDPVDIDAQAPIKTPRVESSARVEVLPLSAASLPKTCYLVVDRTAELIARPLKEFSDLGRIPTEEIQEKTLPVFDNHRVARRFSNRSQRVIKVPDGRMLQKACSHLQAKGITRLLIDGQVYSLLPVQPPN